MVPPPHGWCCLRLCLTASDSWRGAEVPEFPSVLSIQVEFQVLNSPHIRLPPVPEKNKWLKVIYKKEVCFHNS